MAWTSLATLNNGQLIDKAWIDAVVGNINHVGLSPVTGKTVYTGTGTIYNSMTLVPVANPVLNITPLTSGNILIFGNLMLHAAATGVMSLGLAVNGAPGESYRFLFTTTSAGASYFITRLTTVPVGIAASIQFQIYTAGVDVTQSTSFQNVISAIEI